MTSRVSRVFRCRLPDFIVLAYLGLLHPEISNLEWCHVDGKDHRMKNSKSKLFPTIANQTQTRLSQVYIPCR